jgi:hypothetical protein
MLLSKDGKRNIIDRVTVTGADDNTDIDNMVEVYDEYPFVEWGILLSREQIDGNRFPSFDWMRDLYNISSQEDRFFNIGGWTCKKQFPLSGHICGSWVDQIQKVGWKNFFNSLDRNMKNIFAMFSRLQINLHGETPKVTDEFYNGFYDPSFVGKQIIIQESGESKDIVERLRLRGVNATLLFDNSHGAGVLPGGWPDRNVPGYIGYAGGLGPKNVAEEIPKIEKSSGDEKIWIDAETKVRDGVGDLDMNLTRELLKKSEPFIIGR